MACRLRRFKKCTCYPHKRSEGLRRCRSLERLVSGEEFVAANKDYELAYIARQEARAREKENANQEEKSIKRTIGRDPEQEEIWARHSSPS